jgi:hypothetical protein
MIRPHSLSLTAVAGGFGAPKPAGHAVQSPSPIADAHGKRHCLSTSPGQTSAAFHLQSELEPFHAEGRIMSNGPETEGQTERPIAPERPRTRPA